MMIREVHLTKMKDLPRLPKAPTAGNRNCTASKDERLAKAPTTFFFLSNSVLQLKWTPKPYTPARMVTE
jgi:hypothetical protein